MAKKKAVPPSKSKKLKPEPSGPFHFTGRRFHIVFTLCVVALCFVLYGNSISNGYSLDDEFVLKGDTTVHKGFKGIPELFKERYGWDQKGTYGYRPVVKATFAIEYRFFGDSTAAAHTINLLIYALTVIALFYFLRKILFNHVSDYFLLIVAALFLTHPIHTEVVDSMKNRDTMISFGMGLLCAFSFIKCFESKEWVKRVLWVIAGCVAYNTGYMAKPEVVVFVAIIPLTLYFFIAKNWIPCLVSVVCLAAASRARAIIIHHILPPSNYHRTFLLYENPLLGSHWYQRFQLGFSSLWFYVSKLIFPKDLICYYGYDEFHPYPKWTDGGVILGIIVAGILLWFIYKNRKGKNLLLYSLLLFGGTVTVFINIFMVGPGIVAERFAFLPSVGFVLLCTIILFRLFKVSITSRLTKENAGGLFLIIAGICVIYSARTIFRNPDWKSRLSIYVHDAKLAPRSAKLQSLLAAEYIAESKKPGLSQDEINNDLTSAEQGFLASIDVYPEYATSLNNEGMVQYSYHKDMHAALDYFKKAINCDSNYYEAWFNAGSAYRQLRNFTMAEQCYLKTIGAGPKFESSYTILTNIYMDEGKYDEALKFNEDALAKGHVSGTIYVDIGNVYLLNGDTGKAIDNYDKALDIHNGSWRLCQWMAEYYEKKEDTAKVKHYLQLRNEATDYGQNGVKQP